MQIKQVILALCLSTFAIAKNHQHKNGTSATAGVGTGTDTGMPVAGSSTAGRKKHGGATGAASNGITTGNTRAEDDRVSKSKDSTRSTSERSKCVEISRLTKLTSLVNNATALSELETKRNLTTAQVSKIKASANNATVRLTELQANATLTTQCAVMSAENKLKNQCKEISRLTKLTALAGNTTALSNMQTRKNLTDAELAKIKQGAQDAAVKLTQLQSNTTLTAACQTIKATGVKNNKTGSANNTKSSTSAAKSVRSMSSAGQIIGNVVFALVMASVTVLMMV